MSDKDPKFFEKTLDAMEELVLVKGPLSRIVWGNKTFREAYGLTVETMKDMVDDDHADPDDTLKYVRDDRHVFETGETVAVVEPMSRADGSKVTLATVKVPVYDDEGNVEHTVDVSRVLDREFEENSKLERSLIMRALKTVVQGLPLPTLMTDMSGSVVVVSDGFKKMPMVSGATAGEYVAIPDSLQADINKVLKDGVAVRHNGFEDGRTGRVFDIAIDDWTLPGNQRGGVTLVFFDITEVKESERQLIRLNEKLAFLASHDIVTGLPNRRNFLEQLEAAISFAEVHKAGWPAVFLLDLDRFKIVNDTLGHNVGDELLKLVAKRLTDSIRSVDVVARIGGDEFAVLFDRTSGDETISSAAVRIIEALKSIFTVGNYTMRAGASIGIAFPTQGYTVKEILRNADLAMYEAKAGGGNSYSFFDAEMHRKAARCQILERDMHDAAEGEYFSVFYQPVCDTETKQPVSFEALIRWRHPSLGMVSPAEFMPMLEESGLIGAVGLWVLKTACEQLVEWQSIYGEHLTMAVNLSPKQFDDPFLADSISEVLQDVGLPPKNLIVEVTESMLMRDLDVAATTLEKIRALGCGVAIDDFGTGYSQLVYLVQFPLSELKVDQSLVSTIGSTEGDKLVQAVIDLGHNLGFSVVGEGVETEEQLAFLGEHSCDSHQGYLVAEPQPADKLDVWLKKNAMVPE